MPEFRWILLGLGLLLLAGIWWSGRRGASQARGFSNLRDADAGGSRAAPFEAEGPEPTLPVSFSATPLQREPTISPYDPLPISSGDAPPADRSVSIPVLNDPHEDPDILHFDDVRTLRADSLEDVRQDPVEISLEVEPATQVWDLEATDDVHAVSTIEQAGSAGPAMFPEPAMLAEPAPRAPPASAAPPVQPTRVDDTPAAAAPAAQHRPPPEAHLSSGRFSRPSDPRPAPRTDTSGRFARVKPEPPKPIELQKIVTLRVICMNEGGWPGEDVAAALAGSDLVHGRYGVFHRLHADGSTLFYVASLVEPGSFDPARMAEQRFPGLSIFCVLPGPMQPVATLDLLYATARQLATDLSGMMQDEQGKPLSPQRAGQLREDIVTFQQQLQAASAP